MTRHCEEVLLSFQVLLAAPSFHLRHLSFTQTRRTSQFPPASRSHPGPGLGYLPALNAAFSLFAYQKTSRSFSPGSKPTFLLKSLHLPPLVAYYFSASQTLRANSLWPSFPVCVIITCEHALSPPVESVHSFRWGHLVSFLLLKK